MRRTKTIPQTTNSGCLGPARRRRLDLLRGFWQIPLKAEHRKYPSVAHSVSMGADTCCSKPETSLLLTISQPVDAEH
eukprot:320349-Hanusia_phi.AAC.1